MRTACRCAPRFCRKLEKISPMSDLTTKSGRVNRALLSLDGLSIGDAFGQRFFHPGRVEDSAEGVPLDAPWRFTDDTEMAMSLVEVLKEHGEVNQDFLAKRFVDRYLADPARGYGEGAEKLLQLISTGISWRTASYSLFGGTGSFGNGGAMRAAPLGAWFADDTESLTRQAILSAEVTHAHPEAQHGTVAVALAAAWVCRQPQRVARSNQMLPWILARVPEGNFREHLSKAAELSLDEWEFDVANELGCGERVSAVDTVPFCLWVSAANLGDYRTALRTAVRVGGDMDTTCAIVGGVVSLSVGVEGIPAAWRAARESLW